MIRKKENVKYAWSRGSGFETLFSTKETEFWRKPSSVIQYGFMYSVMLMARITVYVP
jgi:hypothetical protein